METQQKSALCNALNNLCIPSKVTCFKFFCSLLKIFPLGTCFLQHVPNKSKYDAHSGGTAFFLSRSPRRITAYTSVMRTLMVKVVLMTAITINLNLYIYIFHLGHEHPSITLLPQTPEDSTSSSTLQESLLEQKFTNVQDQFILKPRQPTQNEQERGESPPFLQVPSLDLCLHSWPQIHDTELTLSVGTGEEQYKQKLQNYAESSLEKPKGLKSRPNSLLGRLFVLILLGRPLLLSVYPQSTFYV